MRTGLALALALTLALGSWVTVEAVRAARGAAGARVEVGRFRPTALTADERRRLSELPETAALTYYVSPRERMPSAMRQTEREVSDVLDAMAAASDGRLRWRHVDTGRSDTGAGTDADAERLRFAAQRGIAPMRVRSVTKDGWSEREVHSSLEIRLGARGTAVLNGIDRDTVPVLKALVLAHLDALLEPSSPRIALAAPSDGYGELERRLGLKGDTKRIDLAEAGSLEDADFLVWVQPGAVDDAALARIEAFRERGGSIFLAASARSAQLGAIGEELALQLSPTDFPAERVLGRFGLRPLSSPLFDERCASQVIGDGEQTPLPFLVRCIAPNQDWRGFGAPPNGSLLFPSPTALRLDGAALLERGFRAKVLATSSEQSFTVPELAGSDLEPVRLSALERERHTQVPKEALAVALEPARPFEGSVVVLASATLLSDEFLDLDGYVHAPLVGAVLANLIAPDRLVAARADLPRPALLDEGAERSRGRWRLIVLGAGPLALLLLALARGALHRRGRARTGTGVVRAAAAGGAGLGLLAVVGVAGRVLGEGVLSAGPDLTRGDANRPAAQLVVLARRAGDASPLELEWRVSRPSGLPAAMRAPSRRARTLLEELARASGAAFTAPDPGTDGAEPFRAVDASADTTTVVDFHASVVLRAGERTETLEFPDALAFEDTAFRVGFALWRLAGNAPPRLALATDTPRLSPAEAHQEYLQRRLFAPSGTDVYSLARAALERAGFDVVHVTPSDPVLPEHTSAVLWLQPRRPARPMLEVLALYLSGGGRAFVAGQHFVLQPQQHRGRDFETVWWPQPQFLDLEQLYFPQLGIEPVREVLFDELRFTAQVETHVNRDPSDRDYERQDAALPFLVRASSAAFADDPATRGLGDQAFPFPARIGLDDAALAANGLAADVLIETSDRAWAYPWNGGFLPPEVLEGPTDEAPRLDAVPLYVRVAGRFPPPPADLVERPEGEAAPLPPPPGDGVLLLLGGSELLKNERLLEPDFRADRLLVNAAADLCLPPELAELAGRRQVAEGLAFVPEGERVAWRVRVLTAGPLGLLLLGALLRVLRRPRPRARNAA